MATDSKHGVKLSETSPAFLHANSTSHTWIFSAIAELIDNAYDAGAKMLHIEKEEINGEDCLIFMDDGCGMTADELFRMLSFGYCEKAQKNVGRYGNGFKSGSMRLAMDAMVMTMNQKTRNVGFLSQTFLNTVKSDTVLVPIISWDRQSRKLVSSRPDLRGSVKAITTHSLFKSLESLVKQFTPLSNLGKTGTRIILYNIKR